jgi:hypothetical protein
VFCTPSSPTDEQCWGQRNGGFANHTQELGVALGGARNLRFPFGTLRLHYCGFDRTRCTCEANLTAHDGVKIRGTYFEWSDKPIKQMVPYCVTPSHLERYRREPNGAAGLYFQVELTEMNRLFGVEAAALNYTAAKHVRWNLTLWREVIDTIVVEEMVAVLGERHTERIPSGDQAIEEWFLPLDRVTPEMEQLTHYVRLELSFVASVFAQTTVARTYAAPFIFCWSSPPPPPPPPPPFPPPPPVPPPTPPAPPLPPLCAPPSSLRSSFSTHGHLSAAKRKLVHVSRSESV